MWRNWWSHYQWRLKEQQSSDSLWLTLLCAVLPNTRGHCSVLLCTSWLTTLLPVSFQMRIHCIRVTQLFYIACHSFMPCRCCIDHNVQYSEILRSQSHWGLLIIFRKQILTLQQLNYQPLRSELKITSSAMTVALRNYITAVVKRSLLVSNKICLFLMFWQIL